MNYDINVDSIIESFKARQAQYIILYGPTASGKSSLAVKVAERLGRCMIINADSMQVYLEIPIITAQPPVHIQQQIPHKLYGMISCLNTKFSVARWLELVAFEMKKALSKSLIPILVGGTGMYIEALLEGFSEIPLIPLDVQNNVEEMAQKHGLQSCYYELLKCDHIVAMRVSQNDYQRITRALGVFLHTRKPLSYWQQNRKKYIDVKSLQVFLCPPKKLLYQNINTRFIHIIENGAIDEVKKLTKTSNDGKYPKAIGLYEIIKYLREEISCEKMIILGQQMTRNYAKRQETWFRNRMCNQHDIVIKSF